MADCKNCKFKAEVPVSNDPVSYLTHEAAMARAEREQERIIEAATKDKRRWWIIALVLLAALIISNTIWIVRETQYQDVTITQRNDGGDNNMIGNDGDIYYGDTDN